MNPVWERIEREMARRGKGDRWQQWLADKLGYKVQRLNNWKDRGVPPREYQAIADALEKSHNWLVGREPEREGAFHLAEDEPEYAGTPRIQRPTPVIGTARLGGDGFYEQLDHPDGFVDGYSSNPDAYALRVKGDSMHPAIRHGSFVVVEPGGRCVPGEYVSLQLRCGRKMVKELVMERADEIVVESVNGNQRQTIERSEIEGMCPVAAVVSASKWRPA